MSKNRLLSFAGIVFILVIFNLIASYIYTRIDLTEDRRYTLSESSRNAADGIDGTVFIDVLLAGNLPVEFEKLRVETQLLLQEFNSQNPGIKFAFVDPLEDGTQAENTISQLQQLGLTPANVTIEEEGRISQEVVFPWAMVNRGNETVKVPLLKNKLGADTEERINNSVQDLEYAFADAFTKLAIRDKKKIAILKGNGELDDIYIADFLTSLREYYNIGPITLDSVPANPAKVFEQLVEFDMLLVAKPTEAFSDQEKYILDQYLVQGGKSIWLVDQVSMALDSLFNEEGVALALPRELNLQDLFFRYGIRINPDLINDLYFTQIVLATGDATDSQYSPVPWYYHPMVFSADDHPINTNLEALRFQFASSIDTLPNNYSKAILYRSSPLSRSEGTPRQISLNTVATPPDKNSYNDGNKPLAVLIEGEFESAYKNRIKPLRLEDAKENGPANKMIVISDGDLIKNQLRNGRPLQLGYDKWTNNYYGNKDFLINCVNYLLDDTGLLSIRNKTVRIPLLDPEKIEAQKSKWQIINIGIPLLLVVLTGMVFGIWRRRRYGA